MKPGFNKKFIYLFVLCSFANCNFIKAQWNELGGVNSLNTLLNKQELYSTAFYADNRGNVYYAAENFPHILGDTTRYFAKWNGSTWEKLIPPANSYTYTVQVGTLSVISSNPLDKVLSIVSYSTNHLYTAGQFVNASGRQYVGEWNGTYWVELGGQNALAANGQINSLCVDSTGNLYAAGGFVNSAGLPYVAKWNGSQWTQLGGNLPGQSLYGVYPSILSICSDGQGNIYASSTFTNTAGNFYVAKWDGSLWTELGGNNSLNALGSYLNKMTITADNHGNIYAAGSLHNANNKSYVAKWNGTTWVELNDLNYPYVTSISVDKYGNVYALNKSGIMHSGSYSNAGEALISKWNGSNWVNLADYTDLDGNPEFLSICTDTSGNLYTSTFVSNGNPYYRGFVLEYSKAYEVSVKEENSENIKILLYPNPAKESVSLRINGVNKTLDLKITDISGRMIKQIPLTEETKQIDISDLSNGVYFFSVYLNKQHIKTEKIIKE